jgi:hypothetical protein
VRIPVKFVCFLQLFLSTSGYAQSQSAATTPPGGRTLWHHNGSIVSLVANGSWREFYYDEPRPGMIEAGARAGSLLFRGKSINGRYIGTAFIFDGRCGQVPYDVSGPILDNYERVVLQGNAPRVDSNCRVEGYITDTLEFTLLKPQAITLLPKQPPINAEVQLGCEIQYATAQDRDPIVSISIDVRRNGFAVVHHSRGGLAYNRAVQYDIFQSGWNGEDFSWRGTYIKNANQTLLGELRSINGAYRYTERIFSRRSPGQTGSFMESTCTIQQSPTIVQSPIAEPKPARLPSPRPSPASPSIQSPSDVQSPPGEGPAASGASILVPLQREGGTYVVPVLINNAITLNFVVDSGASDVSIPADVVMTLFRTGTLNDTDFIGRQTYKLADGSTVPSATFRIRSLIVGSKLVENVTGSVAPVEGALLLGQSFLTRFSSWSVDNTRKALVLEW